MANTDETPKKAEKASRIQRLFRHEGTDELTSRATNETTHVIFKVVKSGEEIIFPLSDLFDGKLPPPCVGRAAAAFGVNTSAGNMLTGVEDTEDPEEIADAIKQRLAAFSAGRWSAERAGGGGRPRLVWLALIAFRQERGQPTDDNSMAKFHAMLDDGEQVKKWMANANFLSHYLRIQAERQAKKAVVASSDADLLA